MGTAYADNVAKNKRSQPVVLSGYRLSSLWGYTVLRVWAPEPDHLGASRNPVLHLSGRCVMAVAVAVVTNRKHFRVSRCLVKAVRVLLPRLDTALTTAQPHSSRHSAHGASLTKNELLCIIHGYLLYARYSSESITYIPSIWGCIQPAHISHIL